MKRKIISLLLCLVMALSLIPTVAFAATEDLTTNGEYSSNGWRAGGSGTITTDGLTLSKTATYLYDNTYRIDLSVVTTQEVTTQDSPAAVALVIDTSGSMAWCSDYHKHSDDCYKDSTICLPSSNKDHWVGIFHKAGTSCRLMRGNNGLGLYPASCGTTEHTHDDATGGVSCGHSPSRIDSAKAAATAFIGSFKSTSAARYVAVIGFNSSVTSTQWYNVSDESQRTDAINAINNLGAKGGTDMAAGLSSANTLMSATPNGVEAANKHVILLSDGAPTYANGSGNGSYGSADINKTTSDTAATLKTAIAPGKLYTICFSAENEICYSDDKSNGLTVGEFLRDSIASSHKAAYKAETATDLNNIFTNLSSSITTGLTGDGWTVNDPMAANISVDGTLNGYNDENKTYTWTLSNPDQTSNGNTTTYTYTTSYTVKIEPNGKEADGSPLREDKFYPTNEVTTLHYQDADGGSKTAYFPVPGVKVKLPDPTPTTGSLNINKVLSGVTADRDMTFTFDVKNGNEIVNENVYVYIQSGEERGSTVVENLPVGTYTVVEKTPIPAPDGYTLSGTTYYYGDGATSANVPPNGRATVTVTNTYEEESTPPAEVSVEISVTKNVTISRGSKEPAETLFTFEASVGDQKFTLPLIPKKAENWTATGMLRVSIPYELFKDDVATVTIKEIPGGDTRWKYDTKEYTVFVYQDGTYEVKSENPEIAARSMNQEQKPTALTFTNEYSYKYTPTPKPTTPAKPVTSVKTGDMGVALYAGLAILSMTGSAGVILRRRKNDK